MANHLGKTGDDETRKETRGESRWYFFHPRKYSLEAGILTSGYRSWQGDAATDRAFILANDHTPSTLSLSRPSPLPFHGGNGARGPSRPWTYPTGSCWLVIVNYSGNFLRRTSYFDSFLKYRHFRPRVGEGQLDNEHSVHRYVMFFKQFATWSARSFLQNFERSLATNAFNFTDQMCNNNI